MNKLQGVNRLKQECGVPGNDLTTTSTINQPAEIVRLINWFDQAYEEIQLERDDWQFLRSSLTFNTVPNQQSYTPPGDIGLTDFGSWVSDSFRIYSASAGQADETFLTEYPYNAFRDIYLYSTKTTTYARPVAVSVAPDDSLVFGLPPDQEYTINCEYYKKPDILTDDTSEPIFYPRYHLAIVFLAMQKYGLYEAAPEVIEQGERLYRKYFNKLSAVEAPNISFGGSFI